MGISITVAGSCSSGAISDGHGLGDAGRQADAQIAVAAFGPDIGFDGDVAAVSGDVEALVANILSGTARAFELQHQHAFAARMKAQFAADREGEG